MQGGGGVTPDELDEAACRGSDVDFFPVSPQGTSPDGPVGRAHQANIDAAKAVCAACPVSDACRRDHSRERWGIWFGTTPDERGFTKVRDQRSRNERQPTIEERIRVLLAATDQPVWTKSTLTRAVEAAHSSTVRDAIARLVADGTLRPEGVGSATHYRVVRLDDQPPMPPADGCCPCCGDPTDGGPCSTACAEATPAEVVTIRRHTARRRRQAARISNAVRFDDTLRPA
jgi:WhiB family redox-sensing transcriptional regulator